MLRGGVLYIMLIREIINRAHRWGQGEEFASHGHGRLRDVPSRTIRVKAMQRCDCNRNCKCKCNYKYRDNLHCHVLHCDVRGCLRLRCTVQCSAVLRCVALYSNVLCCPVLRCIVHHTFVVRFVPYSSIRNQA